MVLAVTSCLLLNIIFIFFEGLCGFVQNNELVSPGYPNNYPHNTDCNYTVYIPYGKALQIYFYVFRVNDCG